MYMIGWEVIVVGSALGTLISTCTTDQSQWKLDEYVAIFEMQLWISSIIDVGGDFGIFLEETLEAADHHFSLWIPLKLN